MCYNKANGRNEQLWAHEEETEPQKKWTLWKKYRNKLKEVTEDLVFALCESSYKNRLLMKGPYLPLILLSCAYVKNEYLLNTVFGALHPPACASLPLVPKSCRVLYSNLLYNTVPLKDLSFFSQPFFDFWLFSYAIALINHFKILISRQLAHLTNCKCADSSFHFLLTLLPYTIFKEAQHSLIGSCSISFQLYKQHFKAFLWSWRRSYAQIFLPILRENYKTLFSCRRFSCDEAVNNSCLYLPSVILIFFPYRVVYFRLHLSTYLIYTCCICN